jgi:hypothetical protein
MEKGKLFVKTRRVLKIKGEPAWGQATIRAAASSIDEIKRSPSQAPIHYSRPLQIKTLAWLPQ